MTAPAGQGSAPARRRARARLAVGPLRWLAQTRAAVQRWLARLHLVGAHRGSARARSAEVHRWCARACFAGLAALLVLAACPRTPPRHRSRPTGADKPARTAPARRSTPPGHPAHEHAHGAHPHARDGHHHHPHPHPHLAGQAGHHHPY